MQAAQANKVPPQEPPPNTPVVYETTTLKELSNNLPIGILQGDVRSCVFRMRKFIGKYEREIAEMRKRKRGIGFGDFATEVLVKMVHTVGPHNFDELNESQRRLELHKMCFADVLYMWLYLRYETLGEDEPVVLDITCPSCSHAFTFYADLGSLEVKVAPELVADLRSIYELRDGIPIKGENRYSLWVAPMTWGAAIHDKLIGVANELAIIRASVCGAEGDNLVPFRLTQAALDEMTKYDLEGLKDHIAADSPGPVMAVEADCERCNQQIARSLDWGWDGFFSRQARRRTGKS